MAQSNDLHHETHHIQIPPVPITTDHTHNIHYHFNSINDNHSTYDKRGSREVMGKNKSAKTNIQGKK